MKTMHDLIAGQSLFEDLTAGQIHALADNARYRRYRRGELIFQEGNLANRFYVVVDGKVALEAPADDAHPVQLQTVGNGEILGWSWMFSNDLGMLRARVLEPTEVIYFRGDRLRHQCEQDHDLGYQLFRRVAEVMMQRLQATRQLVLKQPALALAESFEWRPGEP